MSNTARELIAAVQAYPGVTLVAVSKAVGLPEIKLAYEMGISNFGENRVQDALPKIEQCILPLTWHFIGRVQTNKLRKIVGPFSLVHSLCSLRVAEEMSKVAQAEGKVFTCLIQVDTTDEETKQGLRPDEVGPFIDSLAGMKAVAIKGLMTMGPNTADKEMIRQSFRQVRQLYDELSREKWPAVEMRHLSMGMSSDYRLALDAGSNMVRIGTAIFANIK
ncbi:MAG: YggS family pyridoxal phosphate-dependent enzyme [Thermaerobacter sp.]|nr:YggS family pyridoxal phosphate-dependent enzyme [Thermaerobacter sp.]